MIRGDSPLPGALPTSCSAGGAAAEADDPAGAAEADDPAAAAADAPCWILPSNGRRPLDNDLRAPGALGIVTIARINDHENCLGQMPAISLA